LIRKKAFLIDAGGKNRIPALTKARGSNWFLADFIGFNLGLGLKFCQ